MLKSADEQLQQQRVGTCQLVNKTLQIMHIVEMLLLLGQKLKTPIFIIMSPPDFSMKTQRAIFEGLIIERFDAHIKVWRRTLNVLKSDLIQSWLAGGMKLFRCS